MGKSRNRSSQNGNVAKAVNGYLSSAREIMGILKSLAGQDRGIRDLLNGELERCERVPALWQMEQGTDAAKLRYLAAEGAKLMMFTAEALCGIDRKVRHGAKDGRKHLKGALCMYLRALCHRIEAARHPDRTERGEDIEALFKEAMDINGYLEASESFISEAARFAEPFAADMAQSMRSLADTIEAGIIS